MGTSDHRIASLAAINLAAKHRRGIQRNFKSSAQDESSDLPHCEILEDFFEHERQVRSCARLAAVANCTRLLCVRDRLVLFSAGAAVLSEREVAILQ